MDFRFHEIRFEDVSVVLIDRCATNQSIDYSLIFNGKLRALFSLSLSDFLGRNAYPLRKSSCRDRSAVGIESNRIGCRCLWWLLIGNLEDINVAVLSKIASKSNCSRAFGPKNESRCRSMKPVNRSLANFRLTKIVIRLKAVKGTEATFESDREWVRLVKNTKFVCFRF